MGILGHSAPPKMVVDKCISAIDQNNDGVIQKMELFNILKKVLPV
jgi:Ca2+-binding EF-hand superfamily protein